MTKDPQCPYITSQLHQGWLSLWFDSPHNRNALSAPLINALTHALEQAKDNRHIRGITLRGKHGIFCAGGDLKQFHKSQSENIDPQNTYEMNYQAGELFDLVMNMPQPVIAYVEGAAIAGGLGLMCCADIICVTKTAQFALTETQIGIPPAQIAPIIVTRTGLSRARQLMLTAVRFKGTQAQDWGLCDYVVEDAQAFAAIESDIIKRVRKCAPNAIHLTKQILLSTPYMDRPAQKHFAAEKFTQAFLSDEGREGIASFIEKRLPAWTQQT